MTDLIIRYPQGIYTKGLTLSWGGEFWSDGFYLATVSERGNWHVVEQYVANQGKTMGEKRQLRLFT